MILLDTNVISEILKPHAEPNVTAWLDRQPLSSIWITSISVMEIRFGLELLDPGRRKSQTSAAFLRFVSATIADRIAPFDAPAAEIAGKLSAARRRKGLVVDHRDTQIASIAVLHKATLVSRNIRDFGDLDERLVNPWEL